MTDNQKISEKIQTILLNSPNDLKELALDINELSKADSPVVTSFLLYHLIKEREQTNVLLHSIDEKLNQMLSSRENALVSNTKNQRESEFIGNKDFNESNANEVQLLSEQDQKILDLIERKGMLSSSHIKKEMEYKGLNAASQRLNKLFREGYLKKIRAGRKTFFLSKNSLPSTHSQ